MDFAPSEEMAMLREMADRMLADFDDTEPSGAECWETFADQGILALGLPEELGGFGGIIEQSLVHEALGRAASLLPLLGCGVLARDLAIAAEETIGDVANGSLIAAAGLIDGETPVVATREGEVFRLTGCKQIVLGVGAADRIIVHAQSPDGNRLFVVEADAEGVAIAEDTLLDGSSAGSVGFTSAPAFALADVDGSVRALSEALDTATLLIISELHGLAESSVDLTVEFVGQRAQFGQLLKDFQAVQHRLADLVVARHLVRSHLDVALSARQGVPDEVEGQVFRIAMAAGKLAMNICEMAIQLHGAMGMTDEYPLGRRLRRVIVLVGLVSAWERFTRCASASPNTGMQRNADAQ